MPKNEATLKMTFAGHTVNLTEDELIKHIDKCQTFLASIRPNAGGYLTTGNHLNTGNAPVMLNTQLSRLGNQNSLAAYTDPFPNTNIHIDANTAPTEGISVNGVMHELAQY